VKLAIYLPTVSVLMLLTACGDTSSENPTAESSPSQMTERVIEEPEVVEEDGHQTEASIPADHEEGHAEPFDTGTRAQTQAPHVHGEATLQVVAEGGNIEVRLESPAESIIGFEHPPRDAQHWQQAADAIDALSKPDVLVVSDSQTACESQQLSWSTALFTAEELKQRPKSSTEHEDEHHAHHDHEADSDSHDQHDDDHDHDQDHEDDSDHASIEASWVFRCNATPSSLEHRLMVVFPGLKKLDVQLATQSAQKSWVTEGRETERFSLQAE